ncbi:hypothetical protein GCM10008905_19600 [Clostridium malenominatum]|uniref:Uncharacterized protein n=1 Tax=Clostridium malenominatum TaxID=1539 RepID=A0ABN1J0K9_9CLOT
MLNANNIPLYLLDILFIVKINKLYIMQIAIIKRNTLLFLLPNNLLLFIEFKTSILIYIYY